MNTRDALEKECATLRPGHRVTVNAHVEYDDTAMMFVERRVVTQEAARAECFQEITADWLSGELPMFVRGRAEWSDRIRPTPCFKQAKASYCIDTEDIRHWLRAEEYRRVYAGHLDPLIYGASGRSRPERVAAILCDSLVGCRANTLDTTVAVVRDAVEASDEQRLPLRLLLPAFPFKDQNPFWTDAPEDGVDLGEIGLLIRLHCLALALRQVCSFGVEIIVMSDGSLYQPIFGSDRDATRRYLERMREWRDALNLRTTVKFISLEALIEAHGVCVETRRRISEVLREAAQRDTKVKERLAVLQRGLLRHLETRRSLGHVGREALWDLLCGERAQRLEAEADEWGVWARAGEAAVEYVAALLSVKACRLYDWFAPKSIRLTVHQKPGQLGIPSMGEELPWNGVAELSHFKEDPKEWVVECKPLWRIQAADGDMLTGVLSGTRDVLAYSCG